MSIFNIKPDPQLAKLLEAKKEFNRVQALPLAEHVYEFKHAVAAALFEQGGSLDLIPYSIFTTEAVQRVLQEQPVPELAMQAYDLACINHIKLKWGK